MKSHLQHWVCQKLDEDKQNPQKKHTKNRKQHKTTQTTKEKRNTDPIKKLTVNPGNFVA
jgi:hypothetical protein